MSDYFSSLSMINGQWNEAQEFFRKEKYEYNSYKELGSLNFYNWMFQVLDKGIQTEKLKAYNDKYHNEEG